MPEIKDPHLVELKNILTDIDARRPVPKLAPPQVLNGPPEPPPGHILCGAYGEGCRNFIPVMEVQIRHSVLRLGKEELPLVLRDNLCEACRKKAGNAAMLACIRCKCIVTRVPPFKDPSGFTFLPGTIYHVDVCYPCLVKAAKEKAEATGERVALPKDVKCHIIEKELYDSEQRIKKIYVGNN